MPKIGHPIAEGIGSALQSIAQGYVQREQRSQVASLLERLKTATPIEAENLYNQLDPSGKTGAKFRLERMKQEQAQGIAQKYPGLPGGQPQQQPMQQTGFTPNAPAMAARNAVQPTAPMMQNFMQQPGTEMAQPMQGAPQGTMEQQEQVNLSPKDLMAQADQYRARGHEYTNSGFKQQGDADFKEADALDKRALAKQKLDRGIFESEKSDAQKRNAKFLDQVDGWRATLPFSRQAVNAAENAIKTGDFSFLSKNNLASMIGQPGLKDAPAAQLDIALKQNLLDTISDISARFGNKWLEQVTFSAFPGYGRSLESNMTMVEALKASQDMKQAILNASDQIADKDMKTLGYEGPDFQKRVFDAAQPVLKDIADRTSYRTRSLFEDELSPRDFRELAKKSAPPGAPLTRKMYQLLYSKSDKNLSEDQRQLLTIERAKKMGFVIYPNSKVREFTSEQ